MFCKDVRIAPILLVECEYPYNYMTKTDNKRYDLLTLRIFPHIWHGQGPNLYYDVITVPISKYKETGHVKNICAHIPANTIYSSARLGT
jgi:hypothetical protein